MEVDRQISEIDEGLGHKRQERLCDNQTLRLLQDREGEGNQTRPTQLEISNLNPEIPQSQTDKQESEA